ncbi:ABC transporter permease [Virgibacillus sp. 179-BFC.A HS]|jgi:lantibiotic transport system permease protein|uniref:ABC transporter permease n=1 Tax=Tigheibacillus jepli TaxID=3035914 RepID=A0ABU5CK21_9BACI|nr:MULTISPECIES: ABC transporter permease [unclassified Virgibacillus]MDY0406666.1 ABC transporter permease [Virgibacillus sp. 179-BFC.A HS]
MLKSILWSEWLKIRCYPSIWLMIFLLPLFLTIVGVMNYTTNLHVFEEVGMVGWMGTWTQVEFLYGMVLCPVLSSVFVALLCRFEHAYGGWEQLLAFPISKNAVYLSKMIWAWSLIGLTNTVLFGYFFVIGKLMGVSGIFPFISVLKLFFGGWFATLPLIAIQLWLSTRLKNFALPIAINFAFVMPNVFISSSKYGKYYPWSQPAYAMTPENQLGVIQSLQDFYLVVIIIFVIFCIIGLFNFVRIEFR